jgi:RNA recognition motif-containing protein
MDAELEVDDDRKVYVSRLPLTWEEKHLSEHFSVCFGPVESATVKWDPINECSKGYGFVTFVDKVHKDLAVKQETLHAKKKNIRIQDMVRDENKLGRGRDGGVCFLWQKFSCVKGDECKFSHEGPGACIQVNHRQGMKKCVSFKAKGKCSKGDQCQFLHEERSTTTTTKKGKESEPVQKVAVAGETKICHSFKKKGKCRKGDKCIFSHDVVPAAASASSGGSQQPSATSLTTGEDGDEMQNATGKKRRMDGYFLVEARKKMKEQQGTNSEETN